MLLPYYVEINKNAVGSAKTHQRGAIKLSGLRTDKVRTSRRNTPVDVSSAHHMAKGGNAAAASIAALNATRINRPVTMLSGFYHGPQDTDWPARNDGCRKSRDMPTMATDEETSAQDAGFCQYPRPCVLRLPPEHKHNIIFLPCKSRDRRIGKSFPPNPGMRFRLMLSYRQRRVKKKHPCLAQRERSPSEGIGAPVSEHTSLKIFTSEGGISTPGATEKQSPLA